MDTANLSPVGKSKVRVPPDVAKPDAGVVAEARHIVSPDISDDVAYPSGCAVFVR